MTRLVIGIDVGGTGTKAALVDRSGELADRIERPTDPHAATKGIIAIAEELIAKAAGDEIAAIGVGAAGFVDHASGSVTFSPNVTYDDPQIAAAVEGRTGLPCVIENDANAAAWGERAFGVARGSDDIVMLTLGTGIGSGIVVDGHLVRGHSGAAAEAGHMVLDPAGRECTCGLRGCLEELAAGRAIERMARDAVVTDPASSILSFAGSPQDITAEHVARAARQLDETAREILRRAGRWLGIGLSNLVNLFDPDLLVLGGSVAKTGEPLLGPARDTLAAMTGAQRRRPQRLVLAQLEDAGIAGAAALAWEGVGG